MKLRTISIAALLLSVAIFSASADEIVLQQPVAVVDLIESETITQQELDEKYEEYVTQQAQAGRSTASITEMDVLNIMINDILIIQGAEQAGITVSDNQLNTMVSQQREAVSQQVGTQLNDEQFDQVLRQAYGMTLAEFRQRLKENYLVDAFVRAEKKDVLDAAKVPSSAEIQNYYKKNAANFINPEYVRISHIFISTQEGRTASEAKALADKISRNIRYGVSSYDDQVMKYSDDEGSRFSGGVIGWLAIDDDQRKQVLGEQFFDAAFDLEVGEISRPVKSNAGYHILKILDKRSPRMLTLDDTLSPGTETTVRQFISQNLYEANQSAAYNSAISELLAELRDTAEINILLEQ
jgi:parvulin-like peptidyl-prolyl isomerase